MRYTCYGLIIGSGLCAKLASKIRVARLIRPRVSFSLEQMIDAILAENAWP
jgi:hypothetical protein